MKISRQEGVQSLWSGLSPTLVVAVPNTVIYFTTYEQLRSLFHRVLLPERSEPSSLIGGMSGGLARVWAVTMVSPFELVRTKMQAGQVTYRGECWRWCCSVVILMSLCSVMAVIVQVCVP